MDRCNSPVKTQVEMAVNIPADYVVTDACILLAL